MKRTSITLEDSVYGVGQKIASRRGFSQSFSGYVAWLLKRDAEGGVTREEAPIQTTRRAPAKRTGTARRTTGRRAASK